MDNKKNYLKDKNENPIFCGFEGKCNNYAEKYLFPYYKFGPLCKEHYDRVYNSKLIYKCDIDTGIGFLINH